MAKKFAESKENSGIRSCIDLICWLFWRGKKNNIKQFIKGEHLVYLDIF